jgi:DNA-binding LacI/PurR family transcriptional regulator
LIFASVPHLLNDTPLLNEPGIARVAIMGERFAPPEMPRIDLDGESFMTKALDALARAGKRRVAVIVPPQLSQERTWNEQFNGGLSRHGMETRPHWRIEANHSVLRTVRTCASLLMMLPPDQRPDGLLVADDNLVEQATTGLIDANARVPHDIAVVAHCNFPWPTPSAVPVSRLGYDARDVMQQCISIIDQQRRGAVPPVVTRINAVFGDEVVVRDQAQL